MDPEGRGDPRAFEPLIVIMAHQTPLNWSQKAGIHETAFRTPYSTSLWYDVHPPKEVGRDA